MSNTTKPVGTTLDDVRVTGYLSRIVTEYEALPTLALTPAQMRRLWSLTGTQCAAAIDALTAARILRRTESGAYVRRDAPQSCGEAEW